MTPRSPLLRWWPGALAVVLALVATAPPALAIHPPDGTYRALPCRPTIACTADIVPPGVFEIEAGYLSRRYGVNGVQQSSPWLLKLSLAHWLQAQLGGNGAVYARGDLPASYLDDVTFGLKSHLVDQRARVPALAASATLSVPTWAPQVGYLRTFDLFFTGYVTKDFAWLHADLNFGINVWRIEGPPLAQPFVALALSGDIGRGFGAMVEGYAFGDAAPVSPADAGILSAVSFAPAPWLMFDAGTDLGLIRSNRVMSFFVGLTVIPVDLWDAPGERARFRSGHAMRAARPPRL